MDCDWFQTSWDCLKTNGEHLRNLALVAAAVIGLLIAIWRSVVAQLQARAAKRQAEAAHNQAEMALRQAETAQGGLLNERYQKGADMLGSSILSVRLGGIYALQRLAEDHPEQYAVQILRMFCAFARHPTQDAGKKPADETSLDLPADILGNLASERAGFLDVVRRTRADIQAVMKVIGGYDKLVSEVDIRALEFLDLWGADLRNIYLADANLRGVRFPGADLSYASLGGANLSKALLWLADLTGANLESANLSGTYLWHAKGITQAQLDQACADPADPPHLLPEDLDAKTGQPLVWRGQPPKPPPLLGT